MHVADRFEWEAREERVVTGDCIEAALRELVRAAEVAALPRPERRRRVHGREELVARRRRVQRRFLGPSEHLGAHARVRVRVERRREPEHFVDIAGLEQVRVHLAEVRQLLVGAPRPFRFVGPAVRALDSGREREEVVGVAPERCVVGAGRTQLFRAVRAQGLEEQVAGTGRGLARDE